VNFWFFESEQDHNSYIHYATASVFPKIIFGLKGSFSKLSQTGSQNELVPSGLNGQTNSFSQLSSNKGSTAIFGVLLFPHSLYRLTNNPADTFNNVYLDLDTVWPNEGTNLEEMVIEAPNHASRIEIISTFLEDKWHKNIGISNGAAISSATNKLFNLTGVLDLKSFAVDYSLSLRQFERNFKSLTGFSPKHFHRISRFEKSTDICLQSKPKMTDVAYHFGYFDQAHFIREFKEFSGYTPSTYRNLAALDVAFTKS